MKIKWYYLLQAAHIIFFDCISLCNALSDRELKDINVLTENLFNNLKEDPRFADAELTDSEKELIDAQIHNYLMLIEKSYRLDNHPVSRRSLPIDDMKTFPKDDFGVYLLENITPLFNINASFPKDIQLFYQNKDWYAVAVASSEPFLEADKLLIYKKDENNFEMIHEVGVRNGSKLGIYTVEDGTYIAVAQNSSITDFENRTPVYKLDLEDNLDLIQVLNVHQSVDVVIWEQHKEIYIAFAVERTNTSAEYSYESESPIYKWAGKHFDLLHTVKTHGARKVMAFITGNSQFLSFANFQDDEGETNIYTEIFKYDLHSEKFIAHQKILTNAATDIKFFCFSLDSTKESFLAIANNFEQDFNGSRNYETHSIIYKFVDDYFLPFQSVSMNGATEWLPVVGVNGEFALIAASKFEGIKIFQYDGWRFTETEMQYNSESFSPGVVSMYFLIVCGKPVVVLANENNDGTNFNVFEFHFKHKNALKQFYLETLEWCKNAMADIDSIDLRELKGTPREAARDDTAETFAANPVATGKVISNNLKIANNNFPYSGKMNSLESDLNLQINLVQNMQAQINDILQPRDLLVIREDIAVEEVIAKNDNIFIDHLNTEIVNNIPSSDFTENIVNINNGFRVDQPLAIETLKISSSFNAKYLNQQPTEHMILKGRDHNLNNVVIDGNAIFASDMAIGNLLNNIRVDRSSVLLTQGDQKMSGKLQTRQITADNMQTPMLNKAELTFTNAPTEAPKIETIKNLKVKNLIVNGYLNDLDVVTLDRHALRTHGDQEITEDYIFDSLHVKDLKVNGLLSDKIVPDSLVRIDDGEFTVPRDVRFINDLQVNDLQIFTSLNHINVDNKGKLDILLKDKPELQHMTGYNRLENIRLINPVKLQGKIHSKGLDQINPVIHIRNNVHLAGNYEITGNVTVEELLKAMNVADHEEEHSITRLMHSGIKITDTEIPVPLELQQHLSVEEIYADKISGLEIASIIVTGSEEVQVVSSGKTITGDVSVTDSTVLKNVNGINMNDLESNAMTRDGDQELSGKFIIADAYAESTIAKKANVAGHDWADVITINEEQVISGKTHVQFLKTNNASVNRLHSEGLVNNVKFDEIVQDTVKRSKSSTIKGVKSFTTLSSTRFNSAGINMHQAPNISKNTKRIEMGGDATFSYMNVENINFNNECNGYNAEKYRNLWLLRDGDILNGDFTFKNITIFGPLHIKSNHINHLSVTDFSENTVKTDEPFHFKSATYRNVLISKKPINLKGNLVNLDLENVVTSQTKASEIIWDELTFAENVYVNGSLFFNGSVSDFNLAPFCDFGMNTFGYEDKHLVVNGSAIFAKAPALAILNGQPIEYIINNAWLKDRKTTIKGYVHMDNAIFENEVYCSGYVDKIKLDYLRDNYFSKSRDQNVSAVFTVNEGVSFNSGVFAEKATVKENTYIINMDKFLSSVILNNTVQLFEDIVYIENCYTGELNGSYLVNDLDLQEDVMRYDKDNIVSGYKTVQNVRTNTLRIKSDIKVQGIPMLMWLETSVLKNGNFTITGRKTFSGLNVFTKGLRAHGLVNGMKFDNKTVMLVSIPQNVTGQKTFRGNNSRLFFHNFEIKNEINNISLNELLKNQVYKNSDTTFASPVNLNQVVTAKNININKLYGGVNVTQLVKNIIQFAHFREYDQNYADLLEVTSRVQKSLNEQAYFLSGYKEQRVFYRNVLDVIPVLFEDGSHRLAAVYVDNRTTLIGFYRWNDSSEDFIDSTPFMLPVNPIYAKRLVYPKEEYLYVAGDCNAHMTSCVANILRFENETTFVTYPLFTKPTTSVISLVLPKTQDKCIFKLYNNPYDLPDVICGFEERHYILQTLDSYGGFRATTTIINETPYIIVVNQDITYKELSVNIWKFNQGLHKFTVTQKIYAAQPNSVSAITYENCSYLAISSGRIQNAMHQEFVEIRKFNNGTGLYEHLQKLEVGAPIQVEFSILPTNELILYVLTNSVTEPLIVYQYEGIFGFSRKIVAAGVPNSSGLKQFSTVQNRHFVILQHGDSATVIRAIYKGSKNGLE